MGARVEIEFNSDGFKAILQSEEVKGLVESTAKEIEAKAKANTQDESKIQATTAKPGAYGGGRWIAYVTCFDEAEESENKVLTRAMG